MAPAGSSQEQAVDERELYNQQEADVFMHDGVDDDEEYEEDDEEQRPSPASSSKGRRRGTATDRFSAKLNGTVEQAYRAFGVLLPDGMSPEQRAYCARLQRELRESLLSRPKKTNDNYLGLQEQIMEVLPLLYEQGYVKEPPESQAVPREVSVAAVWLMTPEVMVLMLQHLQHHNNLKNFLTELGSGATAAAAAADNPFNSDQYAIGASVQVIGDLDDADEEDLEQQPLCTIARGRIKQLASQTAAGVKLYEVEAVEVVAPVAFSSIPSWADRRDCDVVVGLTTLEEELNKAKTVLVPVTHLRTDGGHDGPQTAGAAPLTKEAVALMKLAQLKLMCAELGLTVANRRSKAPMQEALRAWIDEHGADAATVQGPQAAALKMSRYTYKNWMNAATDLQKTQHMLMGQAVICILRSYPRVQRWVQMFKRTTTMALRRTVTDRQAGALPSRPGTAEHEAMAINWLQEGTCEGLLKHAMYREQCADAMRGSETRGLQLADRFIKVYDTPKPVTAVAVGSIKMNGKTNQNGQQMYYGHLAHKDPLLCPVNGDGSYQLVRYGVQGEPFPDFSGDPKDWYCNPVYRSASGGVMDYEEHRKNQRAAFDGIDCMTKKPTHQARSTGVDMVRDMGGSHDQALVHGHWKRDDAELSYLNSPAILTMLMVARFAAMDKHYISWTTLQPPQYCLDRMFVTADGVTISQQVQRCIERNRDKATRNVTSLNVARYFEFVGTVALQGLAVLLARGYIPPGHVLLQHPAINNEQYRQYALKQADYSMRLEQQFKLLETPVLGPVLTQVTPLGNMTSALIGQQERASIMTGAVVTYASTAAAAYSQARGVDLGAGADFMLVSSEERDLLLACRSAPDAKRAVAAAMAAVAGGPRAAARSSAGETAGSTACGEAGHQPAADTAARAHASSAPSAAAGTSDAEAREQSPDAEGAQASRIPAVADAGSAQAGGAPAAAQPGRRSSIGAPAAAGAAAAGPAQGDGAAVPPMAGGPGVTPISAGQLHVDGDHVAKQDLMVGMLLHQTQLLRNVTEVCNSLLVSGVPAAARSNSSSAMPAPPSDQQQHQPHPQPAHARQQPPAAGQHSGVAGSSSAPKVFCVTTKNINTVPELLQLFETGWPLSTPHKVYAGVGEPAFAKGLPNNQQQQLDLFRQGYLLVKSVSQEWGISMQHAALVVEVWRDKTDAAIFVNGTIRDAPAGSPQPTGTRVVPNLLPAKPSRGRWTMNLLLQAARSLPCVVAQKDSTKAAAGRTGGQAAAAAKRQRTQ